MSALIFHHVQRSVAPTRTAAHEYAGALGLFGSTEHDFTGDAASFMAERIPTNSVPVGIRAYAVPTEVKPCGGQAGEGDGGTGFGADGR